MAKVERNLNPTYDDRRQSRPLSTATLPFLPSSPVPKGQSVDGSREWRRYLI